MDRDDPSRMRRIRLVAREAEQRKLFPGGQACVGLGDPLEEGQYGMVGRNAPPPRQRADDAARQGPLGRPADARPVLHLGRDRALRFAGRLARGAHQVVRELDGHSHAAPPVVSLVVSYYPERLLSISR
jgi:hypothetical protein